MTGAHAAGLPPREADSASASAVKAMQAEGRHAEARERYADLVARHQRRASRIAFHYLRDGAEADEAVQDAFVKAYSHLSSFREELPFEVWFTRILINGCLDRIKARTRRERWLVSAPEPSPGQSDFTDRVAGRRPVARGSGPRARTPAEAGRRARAAARPAAVGVHAEPLRRLHVARGERPDGPERVDGSSALVSRDPEAAHAAHRRGPTAASRTAGGRDHRRQTSCPSLVHSRRRRHLDDDAIAALWSSRAAASEVSSGPASASADEEAHLRSCAECRARYDAFAGWLDDARADAIDEADEVFPAERLAAQQAQILRRLEALERPARVIAFPRFRQPGPPPAADRSDGLRRPPPPASSSAWAPASCWTSAGASSARFRRTSRQSADAASARAPAARSSRSALSSDDAFLYDDSDAASTSPSVEALQALDALTPRVRDLDQAR